jgi:nicotinamide mononucleotide transporter
MNLFDIRNIAVQVAGYPISYVELIGTLAGLVSVYYASKANILTWPTGIVNEIALFVLFFQVQLYADMFLQVYFFVVTIIGWRTWKSNTAHVPVTTLSSSGHKWLIGLVAAGTLAAGVAMRHIHIWLPAYFVLPAAYPFTDSFVMVASIAATWLLAKKQLENWYLWIIVDVISSVLYIVKGVYFLSAEYIVFLGMASWGLYQWKKQVKDA